MGRKVWSAGEVLAAADLNGYLMDQSVMTFDSAAARTAAIGTPTAGMVTFRADGTALEAYNGTAWVSENSLGGTISGALVSGTVSGYINSTNVVNTFVASTAVAYTFDPTDAGKTYQFTSGSAITATVGTATAMTAGQRIDVLRDGAGSLTISAGSGVTFAGAGSSGTAYSVVQYEAASILCVGSNAYRIIGNVSAV